MKTLTIFFLPFLLFSTFLNDRDVKQTAKDFQALASGEEFILDYRKNFPDASISAEDAIFINEKLAELQRQGYEIRIVLPEYMTVNVKDYYIDTLSLKLVEVYDTLELKEKQINYTKAVYQELNLADKSILLNFDAMINLVKDEESGEAKIVQYFQNYVILGDGISQRQKENIAQSFANFRENPSMSYSQAIKIQINFLYEELISPTNPAIELIELSFGGKGYFNGVVGEKRVNFDYTKDNFYDYTGITTEGLSYYAFSKPNWKIYQEEENQQYNRNYPLTYQVNGRMEVEGKLKVTENLIGQSIEIRVLREGEEQVAPFELVLEAEEVSFPAQTFIEALPHFLQKIENFNITWQYRKKGEENWKELITINHKIYLILKEAVGNEIEQEDDGNRPAVIGVGEEIHEVELKFIYENLPQGIEITNKEQFLEEIWKVFKIQNGNPVLKPPTYNNQILRYYANPQIGLGTAEALCIRGDGQCTAWASLFTDILQSQGIEAYSKTIVSTKDKERFLVKNWEFVGPFQEFSYEDVSYGYINVFLLEDLVEDTDEQGAGDFICNDDGTYDFVGTPQVEERKGLAAQGNRNPIANFNFHEIVLVKIGEQNKYYDPSYGTSYKSLMDFQNKSIAGFYRFNPNPVELPDGFLYKYYFRKPEIVLQLKEK